MINVIGKTRQQIENAVRNHSRAELIDLIHRLATDEPQFTVTQAAAARHVSRDVILEKIQDGSIPRDKVHRPLDNAYRIKLSGLAEWDRKTALSLNGRS